MSVARIIALAVSATTTQVAVWTACECSVGIIVACCPALRVLFRRPGESDFRPSSGSEIRRNRGVMSSGGVSTSVSSRHRDEFPLVHVGAGEIVKTVDVEISSTREEEERQDAGETEVR
jgi:hypothetical protein